MGNVPTCVDRTSSKQAPLAIDHIDAVAATTRANSSSSSSSPSPSSAAGSEHRTSPASLTELSASYGQAEYWDRRYAKGSKRKKMKLFDWYVDYSIMKEHLLVERFPDPSGVAVLQVGCGNSKMLEDMAADSYGRVTGIDISGVVVEQMRTHYAGSDIEFLQMNGCEMKFADETFDLVVEKGTIDALVCDREQDPVVFFMLEECHRVLKPGGTLIVVSHSAGGKAQVALDCLRKWEAVIECALPYSNAALLIRELRRECQEVNIPISKATPQVMAACLQAVQALLAQELDLDVERTKTPDQARVCYAYVATKKQNSYSSHKEEKDSIT